MGDRRRAAPHIRRKGRLKRAFCPAEAIVSDEHDFEQKLLNTHGALVVKFWDGAPHLAQEAFDFVANKYGDDMKFVCIVAKGGGTRRKFSIEHSPTFIFFEDGKEKSRINGVTPKDALDVWCELNRD